MIYGTIAVGAVLAAESTRRETFADTIEATLLILGLYWLAHTYATVVGDRLKTRDNLSAEALWRALVHEMSIVKGAAVPIAVLAMLWAAGVSLATTVTGALWSSAAALAFFEIVATLRSRATGARRLIQIVVGALLGGGVLLVQRRVALTTTRVSERVHEWSAARSWWARWGPPAPGKAGHEGAARGEPGFTATGPTPRHQPEGEGCRRDRMRPPWRRRTPQVAEVAEGGDGRGPETAENDHQEATPSAPPTCRAVWLTALPTAKRSECRLDTAAALSTGKVSPMPSPVISVAGSQCVTYDGVQADAGGVPGEPAGEEGRAHQEDASGIRPAWPAVRPAPTPPPPPAVPG